MARGDVVSDIQNIAAAGNLDFQPAAGVEVMITEIIAEVFSAAGADAGPLVDVYLIDGSLNLGILRAEGYTAPRHWQKPMKLFINNTRYLRITNRHSATMNIGYCGIQTK